MGESEFEREETLIILGRNMECRQCCEEGCVLVGLLIYYTFKISISFILNLFVGNIIVKV
jgi:hypothetical protein